MAYFTLKKSVLFTVVQFQAWTLYRAALKFVNHVITEMDNYSIPIFTLNYLSHLTP